MKQKSFGVAIGFLLVLVILTAPALAGQVVTDEVKSWAKQALEQEKALKTISPPPNSVAILYFLNKTEWSNLDRLQKGLTIMLMTDLSKVKEIQVVERVKLQALVDELNLGVSGLVEPHTASRVGKLLGAEHLIGGDILRSKIDQFKVKSKLLDVPTEQIFGQPAAEGELLTELFRMEKDLLFQIIEELKIELTPELKEELRKVLTTNLQALLYLFQGIEQSDLGNYEKAAEFYQKALQKDPGLGEAKDSLEELVALNLWQAGRAYGPLEPEEFGVEATIPPDDRGIPGIDERRPEEPVETPEFNFTFYGKTYDLETSFYYGRVELDLENPFGVGSEYPRAIAPLYYGDFGYLKSQPVVKTDSFYRYTWTDESSPRASVSATLYMNDETQDSDWIVMSYGDLNEPEVAYDVLVGISPGDGSEEDHPAPGQPREVKERDLSEETGKTIPDVGGEYLTIFESFYPSVGDELGNPFDLADSFLVFRPDGANKYTVTAGTRDMIVDVVGSSEDADMTSLDQAIDDVMDAELLKSVDGGEFKPGELEVGYGGYQWTGEYEYGLQTVGQDFYYEPAELFTNNDAYPETLDTLQRLNSNGFLAYAVQVEEDRVNEQIIEMANHADTIKARVAAYKAEGYGDIRARDAVLTEMADAQSGRVLKDSEGNWVRAQQYVLRHNDAEGRTSVQLLNVCLRGADAGDLSGLSTMDFTTKFEANYSGDLRELPWDSWLGYTWDVEGSRYISSPSNDNLNPALDSMYVKFTNHGTDSLMESRTFNERVNWDAYPYERQYIDTERLTIANSAVSETYDYDSAMGIGKYRVQSMGYGGFYYECELGTGQSDFRHIDVAVSAVYDGDDPNFLGRNDEASDFLSVSNIWDALRVNESEGAPYIWDNNLEIAIDADKSFFSKPIDVVYIPMSRMLWKTPLISQMD